MHVAGGVKVVVSAGVRKMAVGDGVDVGMTEAMMGNGSVAVHYRHL